MSTRHSHLFLPMLVMALGALVAAGDFVTNRPLKPIASSSGLVGFVASDPLGVEQRWTLQGSGGEYGLVGLSRGQLSARTTIIHFGSHQFRMPMSIYAVAGVVGCFLAAAGMFCAELLPGKSTEETRAPNPQGGANGRQPLRSETSGPSAAAASRRSP